MHGFYRSQFGRGEFLVTSESLLYFLKWFKIKTLIHFIYMVLFLKNSHPTLGRFKDQNNTKWNTMQDTIKQTIIHTLKAVLNKWVQRSDLHVGGLNVSTVCVIWGVPKGGGSNGGGLRSPQVWYLVLYVERRLTSEEAAWWSVVVEHVSEVRGGGPGYGRLCEWGGGFQIEMEPEDREPAEVEVEEEASSIQASSGCSGVDLFNRMNQNNMVQWNWTINL